MSFEFSLSLGDPLAQPRISKSAHFSLTISDNEITFNS